MMNKHFELQIKTLENALIDADKSQAILKAKEEKKKEKYAATDIEQRQTLVTDIETCSISIYLMASRKTRQCS
jgi:hypothetical protein